jgi:NAD(P)-dependent dehydrogenase (short-subunit alcohol dehydrogenase family)
MKLRGKTALVTGAGKRIGREIALALAKRGANIVVHYNTSAAEARHVVAEIQALGVNALAVRADQSKSRQVAAAVAKARRHFGRIDILVASAAVYKRTPFANLTEADWDFHIDANLKGPFLFALEVGKQMKRPGKIVLFADWAAVRPYRHYLPYVVSKAGVICLAKALAKELAPRVQVNAIAPGPVLLPEDFPASERRKVIDSTLVKRLGSPLDIVNSVLFLLEGSDFITGHTLMVDGGRLLGS